MILALVASLATDSICPGPQLSFAGEYRVVETRDAKGVDWRSGFVVTPAPICISIANGVREAASGRWIQVNWADEQIDRPRPGDQVVVTAECFEPKTATDIGDLVCVDARLVSREPM